MRIEKEGQSTYKNSSNGEKKVEKVPRKCTHKIQQQFLGKIATETMSRRSHKLMQPKEFVDVVPVAEQKERSRNQRQSNS